MAETHSASHPALAHHFENMEQQREAGTLGMWVFLVTEVMFFGGLFLAYILYRGFHPHPFSLASSHLDITLGAINTAVLIASSLTVALAVFNAQVGNRRLLMIFLALTIILGLVFLGIKAVEYNHKFHDHLFPGPGFVVPQDINASDAPYFQMFFFIYFAMTGVHALHMIIGIGIMAVILWMAYKDRFSPEYHAPVEISGLYWHFVDIVWIFLFPLLYLIGTHIGKTH